uniref:Putative nucleolin-like n=1 Tax=Davidia involucrata TaxID=16924 RepID=A0A5B7A0A3_DAVIN
MVGGGNRRDEGSLVINNTNVFAALESLRRKKKTDKSKSKGSSRAPAKEPEQQIFWAPAPLTVKSWADVDDEDDDDYYATTAPPQTVWGSAEPQHTEEKPTPVEESESEEDILDEGDDDAEEDHDHELEIPLHPEPVVKKATEVSSAPKETERQLSKKERKKKELAELEALLADFGVAPKEDNDESRDVTKDQKEGEPNGEGDGEKKENAAAESKTCH